MPLLVNRRRNLKWLFLLFFLALAIPSVILSWKAFEQLRWESLVQYQQEAASLTQQINERLSAAIEKEESRADADYRFFRLSGDPKRGYFLPSELSKYPVESELPGVIGYFQVNADGSFTTPLLPDDEIKVSQFRLTADEQIVRKQLAHHIKSVLLENQLVTEPALNAALTSRTNLEENEIIYKQPNRQRSTHSSSRGENTNAHIRQRMNDGSASTAASPSPGTERKRHELETDLNESYDSGADSTIEQMTEQQKLTVTGSRIKRGEGQSSSGSQLSSESNIQSSSDSASDFDYHSGAKSVNESQEAFSQLQMPEVQSKISKDLTSNIQLSKLKAKKAVVAKAKEERKEKTQQSQKKRVEQTYIPQPLQSSIGDTLADYAPTETSASAEMERAEEQAQIRLFSSEIEAFRFSLLRSGHLVAYRQVWRQGERVIQGALIESEAFLKGAIFEQWANSGLSKLSSLHIGYADSIMKNYIGKQEVYENFSSRRNPLKGKQLFFANLEEPFNQVSLLFTIKDMPLGAGASFIAMVAFSLISVLVIGTFLLYRLAIRQLKLAQQQQDFVSSVSHELKTPLTSIRMYGEILKQGWMDEAKKQEYYDYIYNESERLSRLIANILQLSKVNRDALNLDVKAVTVSELVSLIHSKIDRQVEQSEFTVEFNVDDSATSIKLLVEPDAFIQVMINLVDNAIKYAAKSDSKTIIIAVKENDKNVEFSVRDFGPGIAKGYRKKIFEPFYRVGSEMTRECKGTGIGLALVRELVTAMNAKIQVKNREPGAEFIVSFGKIEE
ncbi:cell wall metabolism sensor histidine kinase WalK [Aliikangiella sp. G2MR2-5]|uniref:sensor histidine kinase n=1 Tax=Aliikangiella sp. G2MR2-5 TaxID=2788943 RepID=UPI0018AC23A8|nr:ATP-binding protein [Aliikangiella sp. G2MR2-5]